MLFRSDVLFTNAMYWCLLTGEPPMLSLSLHDDSSARLVMSDEYKVPFKKEVISRAFLFVDTNKQSYLAPWLIEGV